MSDQPGLGEQALNKAAEIGLSSQLDEVEELDVDIKTDPLKAMQGQVDTVAIAAEGMVMQKDLRVEEMDMQVDRVAINPLSAAMGKIELTQPTQGKARVVLTAADINRAFNSDYIHQQLQATKINVNGQQMTAIPQQVDFQLPGEGKVSLNADIRLQETNETKQVAFTAVPEVASGGQTVTLKDVQYGQGEAQSPEVTQALVDATSEILNLSNFDLEGISLRIKSLQVEAGKIALIAEANVTQIPSG